MGMTNEQFDSCKTSVFRNLERAQKEIAEKNVKSGECSQKHSQRHLLKCSKQFTYGNSVPKAQSQVNH